jgi:hypothetical protein
MQYKCINHIVWSNANNTKGFYEPYAHVTFEEEKTCVRFGNVMQALHFE